MILDKGRAKPEEVDAPETLETRLLHLAEMKMELKEI